MENKKPLKELKDVKAVATPKPVELDLDLKTNTRQFLRLMQGYNYSLKCNIFDDGEVLNVEGSTVQIHFKKSDNKFIIQSGKTSIRGNTITATLEKDFTRIHGFSKLQIVLNNGGKTFGSWVIDTIVEESAINDNDGQSENKVTITEELLEAIKKAEGILNCNNGGSSGAGLSEKSVKSEHLDDFVLRPRHFGAEVLKTPIGYAQKETRKTKSSGVVGRANYKLEEQKEFDGISDFTDTGIAPLKSDENFSIAISYEDLGRSGEHRILLSCMDDINPYPGIQISREPNQNNVYANSNGYGARFLPILEGGGKGYLIITKKVAGTSGTIKYIYSSKSGAYTVKEFTISGHKATNSNMFLGCRLENSGQKNKYWKGNVFKFYYWKNHTLTEEEIEEVKQAITIKEKPQNQAPRFEGLDDRTIDYGSSFDLRAGVRAIDPEQGEISFTVNPPSINTNESGLKVFTYSARDNQGLTTTETRRITVGERPSIQVPVQSVTLNRMGHNMKVGETYRLIPNINPPNATNQQVNWSIREGNSCTVFNGLVRGVREGRSVVLCTTVDGRHTAECTFEIEQGEIIEEPLNLLRDIDLEEEMAQHINTYHTGGNIGGGIGGGTGTTSVSKWRGKNILFIGDSITDTRTPETKYVQFIQDKTGCIATNNGYSGYTYNLFTNPREIEKIPNKDYKLIIIFLGTNDYGNHGGTEMGDKNSPPPLRGSNFYTDLRKLYSALLEKFPMSEFLVITPLQRRDGSNPNQKGHNLRDYCNAIIDVATEYSFPVYDAYKEANLTEKNPQILKFTLDGLHPRTSFHKKLADKIISRMDFI